MRYLFLLFFISGYSQVFTYTGNVSEGGQPLPGVSICVKGTTNCTSSDFDGNYSIDVKLGDELVLSYIGMKTTYLKIESKNLKSLKGEEVKPILSSDFISKVAVEGDTLKVSKPAGTSTGITPNDYFYENVVYIKRDKKNEYSFLRSNDYTKLYIEVFSEFLVGQPIRLNEFQNQFSQGRTVNGNITYQSPETNEIYSWGPTINSLELSDSSTPYYPNGNIVNQNLGNGMPIQIYNPNRFFSNSFDYKNSFSAKLEMPNDDYIKFNLSYRNSINSIETSNNDEINATISFFKMLNKHKLNLNVNYNYFENQLSNFNFIYNKVIFANAITPIHFDNTAGTVLPDGLPRNFSQFENNPYYLLYNNQDMNSSNLIGVNFSDEYQNDSIENKIFVISQFSDIKNTFGIVPYSAQINTSNFSVRNEKYSFLSFTNDFKYNFDYGNTIGAKLNLKHQTRDLRRVLSDGYNSLIDYPNFPNNESILENSQNRFELNFNLNASFNFDNIIEYDRLILKLSTDILYSSTLENNFNKNFAIGFDWRDFIFDRLSFFSDWSYIQFEPDLQNNNLSFNSLNYRLDQFRQLQNTSELFSPDKTTPTNQSNFSLGFKYQWPFNVELILYKKNVSNLYTPILINDSFSWLPSVDYYQKGLELTLDYNLYNSSTIQYNTSLNFTSFKNKVAAIAQNVNRIPIAGFSDINKNYMVNQPLGVIVGSAFERDANNNIVIDNEGFPIVSDDPKVLGNPNPDFIVGFTNTLNYKHFQLCFVFDWNQGGELWNGTNQTLNYYGASKLTENQRNITGYIFNGVTQDGLSNTQAVSFYDATLPIEYNRWVRYGVGGVAEEAIEDASFFRLNNITLSYTNNVSYYSDNFNIKLSIYVNNVFILSKNNNAFTGNSLFNSSETAALDYFNSPLVRTYGFSVAIKF